VTATLTEAQRRDGLVIRTARKAHRCHHWEPAGPADPVTHALPRRYCATPINPGDRHLEYLGESAAFESGFRYCPEHARSEWGVEL